MRCRDSPLPFGERGRAGGAQYVLRAASVTPDEMQCNPGETGGEAATSPGFRSRHVRATLMLFGTSVGWNEHLVRVGRCLRNSGLLLNLEPAIGRGGVCVGHGKVLGHATQ